MKFYWIYDYCRTDLISLYSPLRIAWFTKNCKQSTHEPIGARLRKELGNYGNNTYPCPWERNRDTYLKLTEGLYGLLGEMVKCPVSNWCNYDTNVFFFFFNINKFWLITIFTEALTFFVWVDIETWWPHTGT